MVKKFSRAFRRTSFRKTFDRRLGTKRSSFKRMGGIDCEYSDGSFDEQTLPLVAQIPPVDKGGSFEGRNPPLVAQIPPVEKGVHDYDSELESLSDILGGPYQPRNQDLELKFETVSASGDVTSQGVAGKQANERNVQNTMHKVADSCDGEDTITEQEIQSFIADYGDLNDQEETESTSRTSAQSWKRQIKHLLKPKKNSETRKDCVLTKAEAYPKQDDRELLECGGNAVVIHFETQESSDPKSQQPVREFADDKSDSEYESDSEDEEPIVDITHETKARPGRARRWKKVANALIRGISRPKLGARKRSRFDDLSTDSSTSSEMDMDFSTDDESDGGTAEFLEEIVPGTDHGNICFPFDCGCIGRISM
ncbi:hypothetical protein IV203_000572 [Nitzschia inconspicua]|uniref:Uncharacterized protein n=1 Tax=Nitzschia inconspicua TaxID=303405 RepID=A0A9K3PQT5_9STRA|nr:hypothetical protein IV203_000572 [Nitzschia inconspicua]